MFAVNLSPWDNKGSQVRWIVWMDRTNLHQSNRAELEHKSNEHRKEPIFHFDLGFFWFAAKQAVFVSFVWLGCLFAYLLNKLATLFTCRTKLANKSAKLKNLVPGAI